MNPLETPFIEPQTQGATPSAETSREQRKIFGNPYATHQNTMRLSVNVAKADYQFVQHIRPGGGTLTGTMGSLWVALCVALRARGITSVEHIDEFEQFLANMVITDSRQTLPVLVKPSDEPKRSTKKPSGK